MHYDFFNDTATTEIYTLSLHDALPICDFHQIKTVFLGHGNGFITAQNTKLFPFGADYPQFTGTNLFVPAHAVLGYIPTRLCIKRSDSSSLHV